MQTGCHNDYRWISVPAQDLPDLLQVCPEIVLGKHVAITSIDGEALELTEAEQRAGWTRHGAVAWSPRLVTLDSFPLATHDECCAGSDELYVFPEPGDSDWLEVFVNHLDFALAGAEVPELAERFWSQMERLRAESYLAEGTVFTFATRDARLADSVCRAIRLLGTADGPASAW